jgi:hypothetical protein
MGDAHGRGAGAVRVEARYARLAVNLAGAMATFLVETRKCVGLEVGGPNRRQLEPRRAVVAATGEPEATAKQPSLLTPPHMPTRIGP